VDLEIVNAKENEIDGEKNRLFKYILKRIIKILEIKANQLK
jgi:hypothetical protein